MSPSTNSEKSSRVLLLKRSTKTVLVIHGGAGTFSKESSTPEQTEEYRAALRTALTTGYEILINGGEAMDAAVAAVSSMEDNPLFNAGKGAVFNLEGKNELETSIMLSKPPVSHPAIPPSRRGFALTLLTRAQNPSQMVRAMYLAPEAAPHAFMSGASAEKIGQSLGAALTDPSYFWTEKRWREHRRGIGLPEEPLPIPGKTGGGWSEFDHLPQGTVGAVCLDSRGCIAAVTSTGGKTNKLAGRVGDTPVFGAGFWAEEWTGGNWFKRKWDKMRRKATAVGISGTGDGDYFLRMSAASSWAHRVRFLHEPISKAGRVIVEDLRKCGGVGGLIAIDNFGNVALPMNCAGMYRGVIREGGIAQTAIFAEDKLE